MFLPLYVYSPNLLTHSRIYYLIHVYRHSYNLVLNKHGDLLYNGLQELIKKYLIPYITTLSNLPTNDSLLYELNRIYSEHIIIYDVIKDIMMYMDRSYVTQHRKHSVYNMSILTFRNELYYHINIRERVRTILLHNIEQERNGYVIDKNLIKDILNMLSSFNIDGNNVYEEEFEKPFLSATHNYYLQESTEYILNNNVPEYINKAEQRLNEEIIRVRTYLLSTTEVKLRQVIESVYITHHHKQLIDSESSGIYILYKDDRYNDIKKLYTLLSYVPFTLDYLRDSMSIYIKQKGSEFWVEQNINNDSIILINNIIELKNKFDNIIKICFKEDKKCYKKLKDSFEEFINMGMRSYTSLYIY